MGFGVRMPWIVFANGGRHGSSVKRGAGIGKEDGLVYDYDFSRRQNVDRPVSTALPKNRR